MASVDIEALSHLFDRLCFQGQASEEKALEIIERRTGIRFDPSSSCRKNQEKNNARKENKGVTVPVDDFILKRCKDAMDKIPFDLMNVKPMALSMIRHMFCHAFSYLELYLPRLPEFVTQNDVNDAYLLYLACAYVESTTEEKEFPRHVANEVAAELGSDLPRGETGDEMAVRVSHDHLFEEFVEKVENKVIEKRKQEEGNSKKIPECGDDEEKKNNETLWKVQNFAETDFGATKSEIYEAQREMLDSLLLSESWEDDNEMTKD